MPRKKMGRPPLGDAALVERLYLRVDEKTKTMLDTCTEQLKISKSDVVRQGIEKVFAGLKK